MPLFYFTCDHCFKSFSRVTSPLKESSCPECGGTASKEAPTVSLLDTPGNFSRKLAKQMGQKNSTLKHKHNIRA